MATPLQLDQAFAAHRAALAALHDVSRVRDRLARARVARLEAFADINAQIAAKRAAVAAARATLAELLNEPEAP